MQNQPNFKGDEQAYEDYKRQVLEVLGNDAFDIDKKMVDVLATPAFITKTSEFFNKFHEGRLLEEDTMENRMKALRQFADELDLDLEYFPISLIFIPIWLRC